MKNQKVRFRVRVCFDGIRLIAPAVLAAAVSSPAYSGEFKVFGSQFAWNNNFNNSTINTTFGTGTNPSMTVSLHFSTNSL